MSVQAIQSKKSAKSQRGYSLIELSIAMAILSVVIVGSLVGVQRILANKRAVDVVAKALQDYGRVQALWTTPITLTAMAVSHRQMIGISLTKALRM